jgi:energy-converting hydrogenase Eha subunit G
MMIKIISSILMLALLQACVAYPKKVKDIDDKRCEIVSRSLQLKVNDNGLKLLTGSGDTAGALLLAGIVLSVSSVVSGSVVIISNTIHFLEKQGRCDDSFLNQEILRHNTPLLEKEGELIEPPLS